MQLEQRHHEYWRKTRRLTLVLMVIWTLVTFVTAFYARELSFDFFGWPFSFYMGAQGAPVIYVLIVVYYAWAMNHLDRQYGVDEEAEH